MDVAASPFSLELNPGFVSLATLSPGMGGRVIGVGSGSASPLSALERRLLEFGFVNGEQVEILAEARPGRDPFVVRIGNTTLALRRREARNIWVEIQHSGSAASPPVALRNASERASPRAALSSVSESSRPPA